ncbi:MAG: hypothetical protein AAB563_00555 [Patescibacteria group bacterium]
MLVLRIVVIVGVVILTALGLMLVFGVATEELQSTLVKITWVVGILTVASLLISFVAKKQA